MEFLCLLVEVPLRQRFYLPCLPSSENPSVCPAILCPVKFCVLQGGMTAMLTVRALQEAKPRDRRYVLYDGDGLALEVMPSGSKIWRFRDQRGGREIKVTLGKFPYLSLQDAREKRHELKKAQISGLNIQEVLNPPKTPTFEEIANEWYVRNTGSSSICSYRSSRFERKCFNPQYSRIPPTVRLHAS